MFPKSTTIFTINTLNNFATGNNNTKYNTTINGSKITVHSIYDDEQPFQENVNYKNTEPNNRKPVSITDTQFCIEKEFLLRYLDELNIWVKNGF